MTRNIKALGLALMAIFALSAATSSAASAAPGLFTVEEKPPIHGGQVGLNTLKIGVLPSVTCVTATFAGAAMTPGPESTYVKLVPTYETCHVVVPIVGTKTVTVTTNGCTYTLNATKKTNSEGEVSTPFSADLAIECPTKPIEIHVYNTNSHNDTSAATLCTYDIDDQTINNQIELTNTAEHDILAHVDASISVTNTITGGICGNSVNPTSTYEGEITLTATSNGIPVGATVS